MKEADHEVNVSEITVIAAKTAMKSIAWIPRDYEHPRWILGRRLTKEYQLVAEL